MTVAGEFLEHVSEQPWSSFTSSDYTLEQWHKACLVHTHDGAPTSKSQCKVPVRTPNGALNRNGVHAAAAALAGARGGVNASAEQLSKAKKALAGLYNQLNEKPPPSIAQSDPVGEFLTHHGVKGMRWGVRKDRGSSGHTEASGGSSKPKAHELSDEELKKAIDRMNLEKQYHTLVNPPPPPKKESEASKFIKDMGKGLAKDLIKTGLNSQLTKIVAKKA